MNRRADQEDDWPVSDPPVAGVPGLGPVPAHTDPPAATETAEDERPDLATDHPAIQEVDGEQETASGG